jgi:hypothetical protein
MMKLLANENTQRLLVYSLRERGIVFACVRFLEKIRRRGGNELRQDSLDALALLVIQVGL